MVWKRRLLSSCWFNCYMTGRPFFVEDWPPCIWVVKWWKRTCMCEERNGPPRKTTTRTLYDRSASIICQWLQLQKKINQPLNRVQLSLLMPPLFHLPFCRMQIYIYIYCDRSDGWLLNMIICCGKWSWLPNNMLSRIHLPMFFAASLQDQLKTHQAINSKIHTASLKLRWELRDFLWDLARYRDTHCSEGIDHMGWCQKSL